MLIDSLPVQREIPHEPGNYFDFRRLNWVQLEKASKAKEHETFANLRVMGAEFVTQLREIKGESDNDDRVTEALQGFDRATLLAESLIAWTGPNYDGQELNAENIGRLDPETAEWAARGAYMISVIHDKDAAEKNASDSIATSTATPA